MQAEGKVVVVNENVIEGFVDSQATEVALLINGNEVQRQTIRGSSDARQSAASFRFYPRSLDLKPGQHVIEVCPILDGLVRDALPGVGVPHATFTLVIDYVEVNIPELIRHVEDNETGRRSIRRFLIADEKIRYRPEEWNGDFIFVDGLQWSPATRYRINNLIRELIGFGFECCTLDERELWRLISRRYRAKVIHFFRSPYIGQYSDAVMKARELGSKIGYDIDDLVFDPEIMPHIAGLSSLSSSEIDDYRLTMSLYRLFIEKADYVTTTTESLAGHLRMLNPEVSIVVNSIGRDVWSAKAGRKKLREEVFRIGYYSGTKTHQADFAVVASDLARILRTHRHCTLRIAGSLELIDFPDLIQQNSQIERVEFMSYVQMLDNMADCDVIIAPLEVGNPYCEAKSELKYFEGVLKGCVVVASATKPFADAIVDGRTGFLIGKQNDWFNVFEALINNPLLLREVADAASKKLRGAWHAEVACKQFLHATHLIELIPSPLTRREKPDDQKNIRNLSKSEDQPSFGFIVPHLFANSGGIRKILRICHDLQSLGFSVTIYVLGNKNSSHYLNLIKASYFEFSGGLFVYNGSVKHHDFLVATSWETAYIVRRHSRNTRHPLYFVQDFEPMFMPMGSGYLRALATYSFGLSIISFGAWIAHRLEIETGIKSVSMPFPLDKNIYFKGDGAFRKNKSVLYFARTSQERRAFDLGCDAIRILNRANYDLEIGFFGEEDYPDVGFDFTNHGAIQDVTELAELYRNTDVGICFSPTNPSLVAYEMLACGTALVDLRLQGAELNFGGADIAYLANPEPAAIAEQIDLALKNDGLRKRRATASAAFIANMNSEEKLAIQFLELAMSIATTRR